MSRPPAAIASAEGCASARPVVQPRPPATRMQPVGPGCWVSAPVVASRCRMETASASLAAVGRERDLGDTAQAERVTAAADRGRDAPDRTGGLRELPGLGIALERRDRRATPDVDVQAVGADGDGASALDARGARAATRR